MRRRDWRLVGTLLFSSCFLTLFMISVGLAAPLPQDSTPGEGDGQEYVVKVGDWLSTISAEYLGTPSAYPRIVEATNAKAATDPRFARIDNPNVIDVGQRLWIPATASAADEPSPVAESGAGGEAFTGTVRFLAPVDGTLITSPFDVEMAADGLTVEPAGEIHPNAGHFHVLIDTDFVAPGELVPFDDNHRHFGQGQLTTTLALAPGEHTLRLQFADGAHIAPEGDAYRDAITVTVTGTEVVQPAVRFVTPVDSAVVTAPLEVEMAAEGLTIEPAGEIHEDAGHFHILVDSDFVPPGELIPFDENHLHFGKGQLTTTVTLEPGVHVLRLQLANGAHLALDGPQYRDQITVTVQAGE